MLAGIEEALPGIERMRAIRALATGMIDYAGLFPPAAFDMQTVVMNYAQYVAGDQKWALGRLIVPVAGLPEFADVFNIVCCEEREKTWLLSVLGSDDPAGDAARIDAFTQGAAFIDTIEVKAAEPESAERLLKELPGSLTAYVEFAPEKASEMLPVLARYGARAKIRMGGVTPEAFPDSATVARFLVACADAQTPFKATAGLHHPVRGEYSLTGDEGGPIGTMHGFVNLFLAATLAWQGKEEEAVAATLEEEAEEEFVFGERTVSWHGNVVTEEQIRTMRSDFGIGVGSCSFLEPIDDLKALGWL
jgi:hypothetical protein